MTPATDSGRELSRRRLFGLAGAGTAGVLAGGGVGFLIGEAAATQGGAGSGSGSGSAAGFGELAAATHFDGEHQAGIVTPAQDRLHFVAFDIDTTDREELRSLLEKWTDAARRMTRGDAAGVGGAIPDVPEAPPEDTGEALDLPASGLTITIGFGPGMFLGPDGADRFGLADRKPEALEDLPAFFGDTLRPEISGGDLCIQACAHDPQVAVHAIQTLPESASGSYRCGGPNSASVVRHPPRPPRRRRETCSASRTARTTSRPRKRPRSRTTCGSNPVMVRTG